MSMSISEFSILQNPHTNSNFDSPNIPTAKSVNHEYILIYLACNDSPEIIASVMENKLFHEECRKCMCNPKGMESEPTWIRGPTRRAPKVPPVSSVLFDIFNDPLAQHATCNMQHQALCFQNRMSIFVFDVLIYLFY